MMQSSQSSTQMNTSLERNVLFHHQEFTRRMKQVPRPDMQATLTCLKVGDDWTFNISNLRGSNVAQLLGRDYTPDERIPIEQLIKHSHRTLSDFSPITDVLEKGHDSAFWEQLFDLVLQQPIQLINPVTQESLFGSIHLELCTHDFQLGQSYQLEVTFKHYNISQQLANQTTSIHDLNGVLRTSLTLLHDMQQNPHDSLEIKTQKIESLKEVILGGLTICPPVRRTFLTHTSSKQQSSVSQSTSFNFFSIDDERTDRIPRQLSKENQSQLDELSNNCRNGLIVLADDMLFNLKVLAQKIVQHLDPNLSNDIPIKQSHWGNDTIIMGERSLWGMIFVANGRLANEIIQHYPVRVLITDNDMPNGLSGIELITTIRQRESHDHVEHANRIKIALHTAIEFDTEDNFPMTHDFTYITKGNHKLLTQFITDALSISASDDTIVADYTTLKLAS